MKRLLIICLAGALTACGVYKPYKRPDVKTDNLYGAAADDATTTFGDVNWEDVFTDAPLQTLIRRGLENNTDLQSAHWRVKEAEAALTSARLAYLPAFNFAPQGALSRFDNKPVTKTYNLPVTATWQIDLFGGITTAKRTAKAGYMQAQEYRQAVRAQVIGGIANLYYTLLMLDGQLAVTRQTADKWRQSVETMRALKEAGLTNEAGVAQYEGTYLSIQASVRDLETQLNEVENSLCTVLGEAPHHIERTTLSLQQLPTDLTVGVPVQMLTNRPDVRMAEAALMKAFYVTASARSALYPSITLSGAAGWTNSGGGAIVNPGKLLLNAAGSLMQPLFNARAGSARLRMMKAQQEEAKLAFQQTLLNAGAEVNNALKQYQSSHAKADLRIEQVAAMGRAVEATELLMEHGSTTYLEVLSAQQSLLSAQLAQIADRFNELQAMVNLYLALGGGREK